MGRFLAGSVSALMLAGAGLFWWQGQAALEPERVAPPVTGPAPAPAALPEGDENAMGAPPPPEATARTREEKRFDRYDRDRDNLITRAELLGSRVKDFRKLDRDGNNLLSFDEWAVRTEDRFAGADADRDGKLTRAEFAKTAPKAASPAKCRC